MDEIALKENWEGWWSVYFEFYVSIEFFSLFSFFLFGKLFSLIITQKYLKPKIEIKNSSFIWAFLSAWNRVQIQAIKVTTYYFYFK